MNFKTFLQFSILFVALVIPTFYAQKCFHKIKELISGEDIEPEPVCGATQAAREENLKKVQGKMKDSSYHGFVIDGCILNCKLKKRGNFTAKLFMTWSADWTYGIHIKNGIDEEHSFDDKNRYAKIDFTKESKPGNFIFNFAHEATRNYQYIFLVIEHDCYGGTSKLYHVIKLNVLQESEESKIYKYEDICIDLCTVPHNSENATAIGTKYCFESPEGIKEAALQKIIGQDIVDANEYCYEENKHQIRTKYPLDNVV